MEDLKVLQQILNKLDILDDVQKDMKTMNAKIDSMQKDIKEINNEQKEMKNEQKEIIKEISFLATKVGEFHQETKNVIEKNNLKV